MKRPSEQRFSREKEIIVYCGSTDCHASDSVAEKLAKRGFTQVYDYAAGSRDWKQGGNPLETVCIEVQRIRFLWSAVELKGAHACKPCKSPKSDASS